MSEPKITIGTVCFLIDRNKNEMLFLERSFEPMKDMFTGVGGKTRFSEDINMSCLREIKEETGLTASHLKLKGVVKTILDGHDSSWILFVYTSDAFTGIQIDCPEGKLHWIKIEDIYGINQIGFIREIMPFVLHEKTFIEGTITHDISGKVMSKRIIEVNQNPEIFKGNHMPNH